MSADSIVGLVSKSLRKLLAEELQSTSDSETIKVTLLTPDERGDELGINLFLYKIQENTALKNMEWQVKPGSPNQLTPPPLSLSLYYLLTAYSPNQNLSETGNAEAHEILGRAMRVFYENPILQLRPEVETDLETPRERLRIMLNTMDMDELSRIWSTFGHPYRLSVMYEVSVVQLDTLPVSERMMATRVRQIGVPDVRTPYGQPTLQRIEPGSGLAGTTITVFGENLSGWKAYARVMEKQILALQLTADSFDIILPNDLPTGFQEIRVDVSNLCRRTFFFEVTPTVDRIEPLRGPAETSVTFFGRDLVGQPALVKVGELTLLDKVLDSNEFQVTIPADLSIGTYMIVVQIPNLYERKFSFEVTV